MGDEKGLRKTSPSGGLSGADFAGVGLQFAAAIVVILMIAIVPVLIYQIRHFRREEAAR